MCHELSAEWRILLTILLLICRPNWLSNTQTCKGRAVERPLTMTRFTHIKLEHHPLANDNLSYDTQIKIINFISGVIILIFSHAL